MTSAQKIKEKAQELGFELVGITRALPAPDTDFFRWWLDQGYAGTMAYLKRGEERRSDPEKVLPGVRSIICCGLNYHTGHPSGPISGYALGSDYHSVVGERLKSLEEYIKGVIDPGAKTKGYVDTGPVLERSYAARAGLGWIGKNTMLINNGVGSFVFLAEILTTLEFEESDYDQPTLDQCGTCTKCLDACPTAALLEPGVLDSNKCISYLTIEYRGEFSPEQQKMVGTHIYGCDICQEICPYNDRIPTTPLTEFRPRPEIQSRMKEGNWEMTESDFRRMIQGSAMDRISFHQWNRNLRQSHLREDPKT